MEDDNIRNCITYDKRKKDRKIRNVDLIKSYILSQPEKIKTLNNFYNTVINIFIEYVNITQAYSTKLKELAIKIKLNEDEEEYTSECQMINIIKTILFFNSESLNEIINDIKKEIKTNLNNNNSNSDNDIQKKMNDKINNTSKMFLSEINNVISKQKKYEKEMRNYEELLINQGLQQKNEGKMNMGSIEDAKVALDSQESYFKSVVESNITLKKVLNEFWEEKQVIRDKLNKKCFFILDTLIFFTKTQNENYELQKMNLKETYSSNIYDEKKEEELNRYFLIPSTYNLKCLDIYLDDKKKNKKRNSEKIEDNILCPMSLDEEKKFNKKVNELKGDHLLNVVDLLTKNKFILSNRDEKIKKNEISKQIIKEIIQYILKDIDKFEEDKKNKLYNMFEDDKENILIFLKILNDNRSKDSNITNKESFSILGDAFEFITKIVLNEKEIDTEILKLVFILSTTYFYDDKDNEKNKAYLFTYIEKFEEFKKKEFWERYFYDSLNFEVNNLLIVGRRKKTEDEIKKERNDKIKTSLFSNLLMIVQNMMDFHLDKNFINEFVSKINNKNHLQEEELLQIQIYLTENKEDEKDNQINDNNNNDKVDNNKEIDKKDDLINNN